jgi:hypothetical protein
LGGERDADALREQAVLLQLDPRVHQPLRDLIDCRAYVSAPLVAHGTVAGLVVAAIVPWNVPQAISFLKLGPALAAGNTVVLKPAPETVLDAFLMAEPRLRPGRRREC